MSLEDFVNSELTHEIYNGQTRSIASSDGFIIDLKSKRRLTESDLERVKLNLDEHFSFVGILSEFDMSLLILKKIFSWDNINYFKRNVSKNKPDNFNVSFNTKEIIRNKNLLDIELYNYAKKLFYESVIKYKDHIEDNISEFKELQLKYQNLYNRYRKEKMASIIETFLK
ncbi:hypothetical protein GM661_02600 [Iocasia frigidifontis]|uniref:Uncharacterized protein n=1 Tax=Iocasia fonsfrigidae TaxID=2682810 RepID=A0A8A7KGD6_9FIRM|nr:hypothetical protein [Iocasia fonsfrigidae]QTL96942.1 hypothetical protein GM661_02600 [Iocasia fonsfrigidae]